MTTGAYRPDAEPYIQRFCQVYPRIPALIELFALRHHFDAKSRVFTAWTRWQDTGAGERMQPLGAHAFYERFVRALEDTQAGLERVVAEFSGKYRKRVEPIDEIGCNDPFRLLSMYDGARFGLKYAAMDLGRFEIARKFSLSTQLLCVSAADPYERVTGELTDVNFLAIERLYEPRSKMIVVHYVLQEVEGRKRLDARYPPQVALEDQTVVWPEGISGSQESIRCRVVDEANRTYYLYSDSRPKERISGIFRIERGGTLTDRRGLMHVVVAVEQHGQLRAATRDDALAFADIARHRLWQYPLQVESDPSSRNPKSHPDFWNTKIVGRFCSHGGYEIASPVEHQITSLADGFSAEKDEGDLGHAGYKRRIIKEYILPTWFPVELYGIDWSAENGAK